MPDFQNLGHKYLFDWTDYKLKAEVSKVHMNHEFTRCQILFSSYHEEYNPHLLRSRLSLDSDQAKKKLAKEISTRYQIGQKIDWINLIEYLSEITLREYEKGDPVVEVFSTDEVGELEYLVSPIAPLGKPTVIFGDPGSGKSQTAVLIIMIATLPWYDNPLRLTPRDERSNILFLDYEADVDDIRRQLKLFTQGMELGSVSLHYRRCSMPLADDLDSIRNHIEDIEAKGVVIDSVSLAAGNDLNKMEAATNYFRALRQLNITSISLAHTSKDRESKNKTILGSVLFEAGARSVWEAQGSSDENSLDIALHHRKSNLSKLHDSMGLSIQYGESGHTVKYLNPKDRPEFVRKMSCGDRILESLTEGMKSTKELAEELEESRNTIDAAVGRLKKANMLMGDSKGWGLLANI